MIELKDISADELIDGICEDEAGYTCVFCGQRFEKGEVFPAGKRFFDAHRAAQLHLDTHGDRMEQLFAAGEKNLSLTDNQKNLLLRFAAGESDAKIAKSLGVAASTVRHQRFMLRERAKAAKLYLAVWAMAEESKSKKKEAARETLLTPHEGATMVDERYVITEAEQRAILENVFLSLEPLRLKVFSKKEKKKIVILRRIAEEFKTGERYTEQQVNDILREIWHDFATLRRYLIEYGYMERTRDGSAYWKRG
ncbi:MAG: DUF2087 domain-containing protein [Ruminococcaceae bacterium]|nr:DUF2087 domain-containing protein [Oscillospiraceae bacterium]